MNKNKTYPKYINLMYLVGVAKDLLRLITAGFFVLSEYEKMVITFLAFLILDRLRLKFYMKFHERIEKEVD